MTLNEHIIYIFLSDITSRPFQHWKQKKKIGLSRIAATSLVPAKA
jgi:hypothetical protein